MEQLKTRLMEAEKQTDSSPASTAPVRRNSSVAHRTNGTPAVPEKSEKPLQHIDIQKSGHIETQVRATTQRESNSPSEFVMFSRSDGAALTLVLFHFDLRLCWTS